MSIRLSSGIEALVDDEDYPWLSATKWSDDSRGYAIRKASGKPTTEKMHRLIMNAPPGVQVDHINGVPWDNRKENLRLVTCAENSRNKGPYSTNRTGYKGVSRHTSPTKPFIAKIMVGYKGHHLGCFRTAEEAARAYNEAAIKYFGEFAVLNVIDVGLAAEEPETEGLSEREEAQI